MCAVSFSAARSLAREFAVIRGLFNADPAGAGELLSRGRLPHGRKLKLALKSAHL